MNIYNPMHQQYLDRAQFAVTFNALPDQLGHLHGARSRLSPLEIHRLYERAQRLLALNMAAVREQSLGELNV